MRYASLDDVRDNDWGPIYKVTELLYGETSALN